jgi:hypothetical protein
MKNIQYRVITNGKDVKIQQHIPWYEHLPFGTWQNRYTNQDLEQAKTVLDIIKKEDIQREAPWMLVTT